jgi:hypothetical protein
LHQIAANGLFANRTTHSSQSWKSHSIRLKVRHFAVAVNHPSLQSNQSGLGLNRRIIRETGACSLTYVGSIRVRDANGIDLALHEFRDRVFLRKVRRMKLETGEIVQEIEGQLIIVGTGEKLERVGSD